MRARWILASLAIVCLVADLRADEARPVAARTYRIPYRLTVTNHVMVRAKINGKGPYNFILDTGAPALFVSTAVCKKLGIDPDEKGWGTFDRFELEGGLVITRARGRVEDPFQLEGMNGLGLAGAELHGVIGYNILARYRLELDLTKDKLGLTPLDFEPPAPRGIDGKIASGGLETMAGIMKLMGAFMGRKANPDVAPRGFLGIELADVEGAVVVKSVLGQAPAATAGLKAGDRITRFQDRGVKSAAQVQRLAGRLVPGDKATLGVTRGADKLDVTVTAGEGF